MVYRTHQIIKAHFHGELGSGHAFLFGIGDNLKESCLPGSLHCADQLTHLILRQAHILETPEFHGQVLTAFKNFQRVRDCPIIMGQHNDDLRIHVFIASIK